jgi:hypothetical protein
MKIQIAVSDHQAILMGTEIMERMKIIERM